MKVLLVLTTLPAKAVKGFTNRIIGKKLAACVSVLPAASLFLWKGKKVRASERLLILKTKPPLRGMLQQEIRRVHPYKVPELLFLNTEASEAYSCWVCSETKKV